MAKTDFEETGAEYQKALEDMRSTQAGLKHVEQMIADFETRAQGVMEEARAAAAKSIDQAEADLDAERHALSERQTELEGRLKVTKAHARDIGNKLSRQVAASLTEVAPRKDEPRVEGITEFEGSR